MKIVFVIVLFVILLAVAAFSGFGINNQPVNFAVHAASDQIGSGTAMVSKATVGNSPRVAGCDLSSRQLLINLISRDEQQTVDQWLDSHMEDYGCIAAK